jgi:hypothetical protein
VTLRASGLDVISLNVTVDATPSEEIDSHSEANENDRSDALGSAQAIIISMHGFAIEP